MTLLARVAPQIPAGILPALHSEITAGLKAGPSI